jgi:hypothetical protein
MADPTPADFGADHITSESTPDGGTHSTAYSDTGGQVSWNTDKQGNYQDGSVHMSDRNDGPDNTDNPSVWW